MKKILLLTILIGFVLMGTSAYSNDAQNICLNNVKLSQKQIKKIDDIEKHYKKEFAYLRGDVILKNMQIAQVKPTKNHDKILTLKAELKAIEEEMAELEEQKQDDIVSCLGFIQKFKYKNCLKRN